MSAQIEQNIIRLYIAVNVAQVMDVVDGRHKPGEMSNPRCKAITMESSTLA